jgi:hypothetical protein
LWVAIDGSRDPIASRRFDDQSGEAAVMAGILVRTRAIPKQDRRKFLNDTLLFLQAADAGAVMISRNSRDLDLLLQMKPQVAVLLYDRG